MNNQFWATALQIVGALAVLIAGGVAASQTSCRLLVAVMLGGFVMYALGTYLGKPK